MCATDERFGNGTGGIGILAAVRDLGLNMRVHADKYLGCFWVSHQGKEPKHTPEQLSCTQFGTTGKFAKMHTPVKSGLQTVGGSTAGPHSPAPMSTPAPAPTQSPTPHVTYSNHRATNRWYDAIESVNVPVSDGVSHDIHDQLAAQRVINSTIENGVVTLPAGGGKTVTYIHVPQPSGGTSSSSGSRRTAALVACAEQLYGDRADALAAAAAILTQEAGAGAVGEAIAAAGGVAKCVPRMSVEATKAMCVDVGLGVQQHRKIIQHLDNAGFGPVLAVQALVSKDVEENMEAQVVRCRCGYASRLNTTSDSPVQNHVLSEG